MTTIFSVSTNKGGVGKTTTSITVAHALTILKKKVLLIDMDPQANATKTMIGHDSQRRSIVDLFYTENPDIANYIFETPYKRLDILPTENSMAALEPDFIIRPGYSYTLLRDLVDAYARANYDYVIIDTPPNVGMFAIQAIVMADSVIIPAAAGSRWGMDGLSITVNLIKNLRKEYCTSAGNIHILITQAIMSTNISKAIVATIRDNFGDMVLESVICRNTAIEQAEAEYKTIIRYKPHAYGALQYKAVVKELVAIYEG